MSEEMEIMDQLISDITLGKFGPDDKLPSENELADRFHVPRITVRKAYKRLEELGYIYSKQGKGSYVKERHLQIPLVLSGDASFSQKMKEQGYNYQSKTVFCEEIDYNKKIFESLGVREGDPVFKIGRLRFVDNLPIALHISYVAQSVFPDIKTVSKDITSMFEYYRSKGYSKFESKTSVLSITFPTKFERELFGCSTLIPFLVLESGCIDRTTGTILELTRILYRSDFFTYVI